MNRIQLPIFLFFAIFLISSSCKNKSNNTVNISSIEKININPNKNNFTSLSDILSKEYTVIQLESNNNSLFGKTSQIIIEKNHIYILDRNHTHDILLFSRDGKFIKRNKLLNNNNFKNRKIGNMIFDKIAGQLEILIDRPTSIIIYDDTLNHIDELNLNGYALSFAKKSNNEYYLFTNDNKISKNIFHDLLIKDNKGKLLRKIFPVSSGDKISKRYMLKNNFASFGNSTSFIRPFCDTILDISGNKISAKYHIDFGKHRVPAKFYKDYKVPEFDKFFSDLDKNKYAYVLDPYFESDKHILFYYTYNSTWKNLCLYSKQTKQIYHSNSIVNDINSLPFFLFYTFLQPESSEIITAIPIYKVKAAFNELKNTLNEDDYNRFIVQHKELHKIYTESQESDNPILIIYNIKQSL